MRQIGRLRNRVSILERATTLDSLGRQVRSDSAWVETCRPFAAIRELSGNEAEQARQISAEATILIEIWWRPGVSSQNRVRFGDRTFEIRAAIDPDAQKRDLFLYCSEAR